MEIKSFDVPALPNKQWLRSWDDPKRAICLDKNDYRFGLVLEMKSEGTWIADRLIDAHAAEIAYNSDLPHLKPFKAALAMLAFRDFLNPRPVLEKGKGLIITGPQGSGKTFNAKLLAACHGDYITIPHWRLKKPHKIDSSIKTIIVDPFETTTEGMNIAKEMVIGNDKNLIFCSVSNDPLLMIDKASRRFVTYHLTGKPGQIAEVTSDA